METTPDLVVINLGTNDNNEANNVSSTAYVDAYKKLIQGVHGKYPSAQVIVMVSENIYNLIPQNTRRSTPPSYCNPQSH